jgi:hypothetical protein
MRDYEKEKKPIKRMRNVETRKMDVCRYKKKECLYKKEERICHGTGEMNVNTRGM